MDIDILIFLEDHTIAQGKIDKWHALIKDLFSVMTWHSIELDISCCIYFWQLESNAI